jgi:hypothetical protein
MLFGVAQLVQFQRVNMFLRHVFPGDALKISYLFQYAVNVFAPHPFVQILGSAYHWKQAS